LAYNFQKGCFGHITLPPAECSIIKIHDLMKTIVRKSGIRSSLPGYLLVTVLLSGTVLQAQNCPATATTNISTFPNTYYTGQQTTLNAGETSIDLNPADYGATPINNGDILLIIQMQGAQIDTTNTTAYGSGVPGLMSGYLNNANLTAGHMECVVALNAVPASGGTLLFSPALAHSYQNAAYGTDGQYRYQVIHIPTYYDLILGSTITAPKWNGFAGGLLALNVVNELNLNGQTIDASGAGFRGGGAIQLNGGTGSRTDVVALSTNNAGASKGEGIVGTPLFINNNGSLVSTGVEGYPNGSFDRGAPGNAGGGGTDGNPLNNAENSGGGGGGNGGPGGNGGNSYGSNVAVGGVGGAVFGQNSSSRLVMGGGGGAGTTNNATGIPAGGFASSGAAGGGIVIISAGRLTNSGTIDVSGASANTTVLNDASGGGGAGGSVLIYAGSGHSGLTVLANGGNGGNNNGGASGPHGPGGGGGGGVIYSNRTLNAASSVNPGLPGTTNGGINYGAVAGTSGVFATGVPILPPLFCVVLPLQFLSADGAIRGSKVMINWQVANEKNITSYIIEKSSNAVDFFQTGTAIHKRGNSDINKYSFQDASSGKEQTIFYRIKAQDAQGYTTLSKIITVKTVPDGEPLSVSHDPSSGTSTIRWMSTVNGNMNITLFDITGHAMLSRRYQLKKGMNELLLTNLEALSSGLYIVQAYDGTMYRNGKLLIRH
jgi:hypothetical protein